MYCFPGNSWTTERDRVSQTRSVLSWLDCRTHVSFGIHTISVGCAHIHTHKHTHIHTRTHTQSKRKKGKCVQYTWTHTRTQLQKNGGSDVEKYLKGTTTNPVNLTSPHHHPSHPQGVHPHTIIHHTHRAYIPTPSSITPTGCTSPHHHPSHPQGVRTWDHIWHTVSRWCVVLNIQLQEGGKIFEYHHALQLLLAFLCGRDDTRHGHCDNYRLRWVHIRMCNTRSEFIWQSLLTYSGPEFQGMFHPRKREGMRFLYVHTHHTAHTWPLYRYHIR